MSDLSRSRGDVSLANGFEGINSLCVFFPDLHDFSKAAFTDDFEKIEGFDSERFVANGPEVNFEMKRAGACSGGIPLVGCMLQPK